MKLELTTQQAYYIANVLDEDLELELNRHTISPEAYAFGKRITQKIRKQLKTS